VVINKIFSRTYFEDIKIKIFYKKYDIYFGHIYRSKNIDKKKNLQYTIAILKERGNIMFLGLKKKSIKNSRAIMFLNDVITCDMFGVSSIIPKGTEGIVSAVNVVETGYDAKYEENIEVTYGEKQRVLLTKYWHKVVPV
jgi:hypothetical protein